MPRVVVGSFFAAPAASTVKSLPRCLATQARPMTRPARASSSSWARASMVSGETVSFTKLEQLAHAEEPYRCMVS
jgi:hypothetical protein